MHNYIRPLVELFRQNANAENAAPMAKYMKNLFPYLGIKTPQRRELLKQFFKEYGVPEISYIKQIILDLWELPEREFQYCAVGILRKFSKKLDKEMIDLFEYLIVHKSWWDTVDGLACWLVGNHFKRFPEFIRPYTEKWMKSGNMWLQRTVILFQLDYKEKTDVELLFENIKKCTGSKEFFIQKAIGWALREYSKTDEAIVIDFVENNKLASLSKRESLKRLKKKI
ncbi:MAG: DNA alkylation repair protein [Candidatus Cloacimonetes bacterium]|nr:DNA alkylation repair protein [Candidatus Cloacimonadota bacterium]